MTPSITPDQYRAMTAKPAKGNKYNAKRTQRDGMWFDSEREADRWSELKLLEKAGEIINLKRQERYPLLGANGDLKGASGRTLSYIADFTYFDRRENRQIVEDIKGHQTDVSRLKLAIMAAQGLPVRVVR